MAALGFVLLLLLGLFFLVAAMVPGKPRQLAVRWAEALLGTLLQSMLITALIGAVMILSAILNAYIPTAGLFVVALLNVAGFIVAMKIRGMFEGLSGMSSPAGGGVMGGYMAARLLGSAAGGMKSLGKLGAKTGALGAKTGYAGGKGLVNQVMDPNSSTNRAARFAGSLPGRAGQFMRVPPPVAAPRSMAHATPYRPHGATPAAAGNQLPSGHAAASVTAPIPLPAGQSSRPVPRALPAAASATTTATSRGFVGSSGTPGVVHSARRVIEQPMRKDIQTPPRPAPTSRSPIPAAYRATRPAPPPPRPRSGGSTFGKATTRERPNSTIRNLGNRDVRLNRAYYPKQHSKVDV